MSKIEMFNCTVKITLNQKIYVNLAIQVMQ